MAPMRAPPRALGLVCLLAWGSVLVAGCGGGDPGTSSQVNPDAETGRSVPAPPKSAFPAPEGRSLRDFVKAVAEVKPEVKVSPAGEVFYPGRNRYAFLVAEKGVAGKTGKEVTDAEVAIYFSKVPTPVSAPNGKPGKGEGGKAKKGAAFRQAAVGPFPAKIESLATEPAFQGKTTTEAADVASVVYSAELDFPGAGEYRPVVVIKEKGGIAEKSLKSIHVGEFAKIPKPGERAPLIQTPTAESVDGNLAELSTRVPPDTQNKVNYAEVLGKEPILLLFTTPKFCQSRVCGPVVDVAQQAQHEFEGKANFIHMEIYNDNDPSKGVRPQVRRFHLPTEPWLFAINREGFVSSAIEGAFGTRLMRKTVEAVIAE
jgi:hypothetical protein